MINVRKPIITGLMSIATLGACKAQAVQLSSETGVTGNLNQEMVYFSGMHAVLNKQKNTTDMYCGMVVNPEKQLTFESQLENEYSWTKNISSWVRETFHLSKEENNLTSEIAPIKINNSFDKFDTFAAPVYLIGNDFKEKEHIQALGLVLSTVYNIDSNNSIKFEAEYTSEPAKNIFKTKFGKLKDNISYIISYIKNF